MCIALSFVFWVGGAVAVKSPSLPLSVLLTEVNIVSPALGAALRAGDAFFIKNDIRLSQT